MEKIGVSFCIRFFGEMNRRNQAVAQMRILLLHVARQARVAEPLHQRTDQENEYDKQNCQQEESARAANSTLGESPCVRHQHGQDGQDQSRNAGNCQSPGSGSKPPTAANSAEVFPDLFLNRHKRSPWGTPKKGWCFANRDTDSPDTPLRTPAIRRLRVDSTRYSGVSQAQSCPVNQRRRAQPKRCPPTS